MVTLPSGDLVLMLNQCIPTLWVGALLFLNDIFIGQPQWFIAAVILAHEHYVCRTSIYVFLDRI